MSFKTIVYSRFTILLKFSNTLCDNQPTISDNCLAIFLHRSVCWGHPSLWFEPTCTQIHNVSKDETIWKAMCESELFNSLKDIIRNTFFSPSSYLFNHKMFILFVLLLCVYISYNKNVSFCRYFQNLSARKKWSSCHNQRLNPWDGNQSLIVTKNNTNE